MYLVIGKNDCPWCKKAVSHLKDTREDYAYLNLDEFDDVARANFVHTLKYKVGIKTVPAIFNLIGGYEQLMESYDR